MSLFISYSHEDRDFVDRLAIELVKARASVWLDRWELRIGDSLLDRIQDAIERAEALLVVLTRASVDSEWCRRELNAGTVRELEEAQVLVFPILVEDCDIPLLLRDKYYADFREDFDSGMKQVLRGIAAQISTTLGRTRRDEDIDYAVDWLTLDNRLQLRLTAVQIAMDNPYTVITEIRIIANEILTRRYSQYEDAGLDWVGRMLIFELVIGVENFLDKMVLIVDDLPATQKLQAIDPRSGIAAEVIITCRRLGADTGMDILVPVGRIASNIIESMRRRMRPLTEAEHVGINAIIRSYPG